MFTRRTFLTASGGIVFAGGLLLAGDAPRSAGAVLLPSPSGGDDTAALNAALRAGAGGLVRGPRGAHYQVSAPLVVHSGTTVIMSGCRVTLVAGSACNLLTNAAVAAGGRDRDITVVGGTWVRAHGVGGTGPDLHSLRWRRVDGLALKGLAVETASDKYAISLGDVTDATVARIRFATHSDGVHIQGPAARTTISGIRGTTGDDTVAITPRDWQAYDDVWGPVTDTVIEDVNAASLAALVKVLGGSPETAALRTTVRGVTGLAGNNVIWVGDDTADWRTTGGRVDDLLVEGIAAATLPGRGGVLHVNGSAVGTVRVRGVRVEGPGRDQPQVRVAPLRPATVDALTVEDVDVEQLGPVPLVAVGPTATVRRLLLDGVTVAGTSAGTSAGASPSASIAQVAGVVDDLTVRAVSMAAAADSHLLDLPGWAADATVRRADLTDLRVVGGGLVTAIAGTHTLPRVDVANAITVGMAWLVDLNTRTDLHLSNVTMEETPGGVVNVRGHGAAVVHGSGLRSTPGSRGVAIAAGGSLVSYAPDLAVDVSELVRADGSRATNTNPRLSCGTGPVVCAGLTWQHVETGATY
ncbi:hypothetical protein ACFOOK_27835 [Micromonospora krabiensis]|uniref:Right handed beta helix region n=1 Tax=Micromonospora krabiensis TaxID=307121 RepID=A0A1C3N4W1_9ACTN|nr:hypothetical protein [Micromonospora krabiensis]SBV27619.1 hypothetical protein GA0070620_3145 [Micromonospora krabiensis]